MKTLVLSAHQQADIAKAAQLIEQGELVAVPTETVYGLAADARNAQAVAKIFAAKGRPTNHPLIVHLADHTKMADWAKTVPETALKLAAAFWPGPLTLLLNKAEGVSDVVTGGLTTVGLRVPAHPALLSLLQQYDLAVAAPSANPYKKLSPTCAEHVLTGLNGKLAAVLDGGACEHGLESTIVDLTGDTVQILRAGPITADELSAVLGQPVTQPQQHNKAVPGNVKAHYQPNTLLRVMNKTQLNEALQSVTAQIALLSLETKSDKLNVHFVAMPTDAKDYGQVLFRELAKADTLGLAEIWLESPPQGQQWLAAHDRLKRAATHLG
ncbi:L-threonylcarbamoyladenylate synthase [Pseudoalteromonas tunicata]|uniref:L-threonylcarbamoyladenylate synthase n=1 Tax=Pseudoalteromonas tunicata TaxID=314281 RepID=UPI00273D1163|nr:L-threonylcarbamoyladenylate synthase [Pseudoalteromonas tunicata]MDP5213406.1 L-threonylcarbamoyladenylate synthase [Pseudoalteromonas tunicata]